MSNLLNFKFNDNRYEISLVPKDRASGNSVEIGGKRYSIEGDKEAVSLFQQKTRGMDLCSMQISELQSRLSLIDDPHSIPRVFKSNKVAVDTLLPQTATQQTIKNKGRVLNELQPTWPVPGASVTENITERMKDLGVPGVRITVINNGEVEWTEGVGELKKPKQMIQAASISKTITTLTVMMQIQKGLITPKDKPLTLDTNIQDILDPDLWDSISKGKDTPITIAQLMSHTAGLEEDTPTGYRGYERIPELEIEKTDHQIAELEEDLQNLLEDDTVNESKNAAANRILNHIDQLKLSKERVLKGELPQLEDIIKGHGTNSPPVQVTGLPGSHYAYSGGGSMILQKIIEIIAEKNALPKAPQKKYADIVEETIFKPLGMKDSNFTPPEFQTVHGNDDDAQPLPGKWVQQPELAAAGLWTTPEDLAKVVIGIQKSLKQEGGFLNPELAQKMVTPPSLDDLRPEDVPGLGVFIDKTAEATYFYHSGSNLGFRCHMIANDKGQGAVVMTNSELGDALIPEVIRKIADIYKWEGGESLHQFPSLHPEVISTSQVNEPIDKKNWVKNLQGSYANNDRPHLIVSVRFSEEENKIYFRTPNPNMAPLEIIPLSEHVGKIKEDGRWFPIEFSRKEDNSMVLTFHNRDHTILPSTELLI